MPVVIGTYTVPSNSKPLLTPSQPYIRLVPVAPPKLWVTNSYRPLGDRVIAELSPAIVATFRLAPTFKFSAWKVPVSEAEISRPAASPPANDPDSSTTLVMTAVAAEVAPVMVSPSAITQVPPDVNESSRPRLTADQPRSEER